MKNKNLRRAGKGLALVAVLGLFTVGNTSGLALFSRTETVMAEQQKEVQDPEQLETDEAGYAILDSSLEGAVAGTGLQKMERMEVSLPDVSEEGIWKVEKAVDVSDTERAYWKQFAGRTIYDQMSDAKKLAYDNLYEAALQLAVGTEDVDDSGYWVPLGSLFTENEVHDLLAVFRFENPQFYFLENRSGAGNDWTESWAGIAIYDDFQNGAARANYTNIFKANVANYLATINQQGSDLAKEQAAHDLLCQKLTYGTQTFDQSAASVFLYDNPVTVCAGYSAAFELLVNAATNFDTLVITSDSHAWNEVQINGYWYVVDVTWDDSSYGYVDDFCNVNYATLRAEDQNQAAYQAEYSTAHVPEELWDTYPYPQANYIEVYALTHANMDAVQDYAYTGAEILPTPEVSIYGVSLVCGETMSFSYANNVYGPIATVTANGYGTIYHNSVSRSFAILGSGITPIYRLYLPDNGEHLFTPDANEARVLNGQHGWVFEGIAWYAPGNDATPVYRLYNPGLANHLYTTDLHEIEVLTTEAGWVMDNNGAALFYSGGDVGIYRLYNFGLAGMHLLTTDGNEYNVLPAYGWEQEGIGLSGIGAGTQISIDQI